MSHTNFINGSLRLHTRIYRQQLYKFLYRDLVPELCPEKPVFDYGFVYGPCEFVWFKSMPTKSAYDEVDVYYIGDSYGGAHDATVGSFIRGLKDNIKQLRKSRDLGDRTRVRERDRERFAHARDDRYHKQLKGKHYDTENGRLTDLGRLLDYTGMAMFKMNLQIPTKDLAKINDIYIVFIIECSSNKEGYAEIDVKVLAQ